MATVNWQLDESHSSISFSVRHMMISTVRGHFGKFDATVSSDAENISSAKISVTIDPKSIDTRNEQRDEHLRSVDFFHVEQHPSIVFESTGLTRKSGEDYSLEGNLSIAGTTKPVKLDCEIAGPEKDPWGNDRIGVVANGGINRKDFNLVWNAALESGGVLVGDQVKLIIEMEFIKQA